MSANTLGRLPRRSLALARALHTTSRAAANQQPIAYHQQEVDPQLNGYPQLPWISRQRLPAKGWTDPQMRRNFGDTMHEYEEAVSMWGLDVPAVDPRTALRHFSVACLGFLAFGMTAYYALVPAMPAIRREYPYGGLVTELGGIDENKARVEQVEDAE